MDAVVRAVAVYIFLLIVLHISGRRTLGEMSAFDFVVVLIIGEATQQALLGEDFSITNSFIVILTLIGLDIAASLLKQKSSLMEKLIDGTPTVLIKNGHLMKERLRKSRVDVPDILEAARESHGISALGEIAHAVLEKKGTISVIPKINKAISKT